MLTLSSTRTAARIGHSIHNSEARTLLTRTASGDQNALASLYDLYAPETYSVCAHYVKDQPRLDETMMQLWLLYWTEAAALAARDQPVRDILLSTAHAHASQLRQGQGLGDGAESRELLGADGH